MVAGGEQQCVVHDRGLSAVMALGVFAVDSKLKVLILNCQLSVLDIE